MVFTGTYEHVIDTKNRVAIPAEIRSLIKGATGSSEQAIFLFVTLGEDHSLCLYTPQEFEKRAEELDRSERDPDEILPYETVFYSLARRVEMDKTGRVRLPESLLEMTGLAGEVVLIGAKDHLEIRNRAAWQEYVKQVLADQPQLLMNPRRALRRGPAQQD